MNLPAHPPFSFQTPASAADTLARWKTEGLLIDPIPGRRATAMDEETTLVLHHEEENAFVGLVRLSPSAAHKSLQVSIWIAPPFRQNGYATAAGKILIEAAFEQGFERLEAAHPMDTPGASQLAERLGLLPEGVQRGALAGPRGRVDVAHWGLLRSDR